jgi:tRNA threonylcarbamoyl adenosine modification protein YeaZ
VAAIAAKGSPPFRDRSTPLRSGQSFYSDCSVNTVGPCFSISFAGDPPEFRTKILMTILDPSASVRPTLSGIFFPALALSCSADGVSAALATWRESGRVSIECWHESDTAARSDVLLSTVDSMLAANRTPASAIRHVMVDIGPGPFTALRMTSAIAQGIAMAVGASCTDVSSTEALAWQAVESEGAGRHTVLVAIDARMGEVYGATVEVDIGPTGELQRVAELRTCTVGAPEAMWDIAGPGEAGAHDAVLFLAGNAWRAYATLEASVSIQARAAGWLVKLPLGAISLRASAVAAVSLSRLSAGSSTEDTATESRSDLSSTRSAALPASGPAPRYVRNKVALDVAEQAAARVRAAAKGAS